jgi:hypothetical protein
MPIGIKMDITNLKYSGCSIHAFRLNMHSIETPADKSNDNPFKGISKAMSNYDNFIQLKQNSKCM